jgi:large subunit ribosomal protein L10
MPTTAKVQEVEQLVKEFSGAKSVLLADFVGMDVATITELRKRCRAEGVTIRVAKNTLSRRALESLGIHEMSPMLEGPTAIAIAWEDEMAAVRVITAFAKEKEKPRVKGGMVDRKVYTLPEIKTLAGLPGRNELIGQLLMTFESPVTQVVGMLNRMTTDLISILDQLVEKKGGAGAAAAAQPAAAAEPTAAGATDEATAASDAEPTGDAEPAGDAEAAGASD